jgi:cysteine-rich repeat protein
MATRPAFSVLVFALAGCIGDNEVVIHGGGDGGGSPGADPTVGEDNPEGGATHGGGGGEGGEGSDSSGGYEDGCGDGVMASSEECDDGNEADGDGCESDCRVTIGVRTFALGGAHTCVVDYDGQLRCWGDNTYGQLGYASLGLPNVGATFTPAVFDRTVSIKGAVSQLALGVEHTCALTVDGAVYCWGRNDAGQLGYGHTEDLGDEPGEAPIDVGPVQLPTSALSVAAGSSHTCALLDDGELHCWGDGSRGQLGIGDGFDGDIGAGLDPYPRAVDGPPLETLGMAPRSVQIGVGAFGCVTDPADDVYCWGANECGQLGIGSDVDAPAMTGPALLGQRVMQMAIGQAHACATNELFEVLCWGAGGSGQLGYARTDDIGDDEPPRAGVVDLGGYEARQLAAGADFTCALLEDASVRCWGSGAMGQLGYGTTQTVGDDESPADWPGFGPVHLLMPATEIAAGAHHVCARTADAQLRCWGSGADGRLGYADETDVGADPDSLPMHPVPIF